METVVYTIREDETTNEGYERATAVLREGGIVAFPTETVYGLGALATEEQSVQAIFEAKGRPSDNPLIVHIGSTSQVEQLAQNVSADAYALMDAFWPGPLTLIFHQQRGKVARNVTAGLETVGLRMPDHPVALELLRRVDAPIAAPSANRSGKPSPTEAAHVAQDLNGRVPVILDGGSTAVGVESTILDMTTTPPTILRPGGVPRESIQKIIGPVQEDITVKAHAAPRAPGMKYMHYAPEAPLFVVDPTVIELKEAVRQIHEKNQKIAIIGPDELFEKTADWYFSIGQLNDHRTMAANLYRALRQCDLTDADVILAVETNVSGVGSAVMNRLTKAADGKRYPEDQQ